jgi:hypothetical protein
VKPVPFLRGSSILSKPARATTPRRFAEERFHKTSSKTSSIYIMTRSFPSNSSTSSPSGRSSSAVERSVAAMLGIRLDEARILLVDSNKRRGLINDATALSHLDEVAAARQVWQEQPVNDRRNINIKKDDEHSHKKKHQQPEQPQTSSSSSLLRSRSIAKATTKKSTTVTKNAVAASPTGDLNAFECCLCVLLFPFEIFFS